MEPVQISDRNLHEEWLNDTPEEEAAFWAGMQAEVGAVEYEAYLDGIDPDTGDPLPGGPPPEALA